MSVQYVVMGISCVDLKEKKLGYRTIHFSTGLQALMAEGIQEIGVR